MVDGEGFFVLWTPDGVWCEREGGSAVACASFEVESCAGRGEMLVTLNSASLLSTLAVVGRLSSQIMSQISLGSLEKRVKAAMMVVMMMVMMIVVFVVMIMFVVLSGVLKTGLFLKKAFWCVSENVVAD